MSDNAAVAPLTQLLARLANKTATIGIIGMGYVGLPLMLRFSEVGFRTIGFDNDPDKVAKLNRGVSYIKHIPASGVNRARAVTRRVTKCGACAGVTPPRHAPLPWLAFACHRQFHYVVFSCY